MSRERPRGGPPRVDKAEGAVGPQQGQPFLLLDQEALDQERRIRPWTIEFGNVHADPELVRLDFDQHGLGSDLEKPRFRLPHRQFSSVNFMRGKTVYARVLAPRSPIYSLGNRFLGDDGICYRAASKCSAFTSHDDTTRSIVSSRPL